MREIQLSRGLTALVDDEDYENLSRYRWYANPRNDNQFYACRKALASERRQGAPERIYMHRELMSVETGFEVDHRNRNTLDNRKSNLRVCTHAQNGRNQTKQSRDTYSKHKGVTYIKSRDRWVAYIKVNGKRKHLGVFSSDDEAALVYNDAAVKHFGEFANLNVVMSEAV